MTKRLAGPAYLEDVLSVADYSPDVIVRYDLECRRVYVNPTYGRLHATEPALLLGKTPSQIVPTEISGSADALEGALKKVIASAKPESLDLWWTSETGRKVCFETRFVPEFDENGAIQGVLAVGRDVTEQREILRQFLIVHFALDQMVEAFYLVGEDARILQVNQGACRALGYSRDELLQLSIFDIDTEFTTARWHKHWKSILADRAVTFQSFQRTRDGRVFPVEVTATYFEFDGKAYNMALVQDITERQHHEEELRRRELEFRALAENTPDTIVRYDRDCRRIYVNPAFARIFGMPAEKLLGGTPMELAPTASTLGLETALREVLATGHERSFERTWQTLDNRTMIGHFRLTPEFGPDGQITSVLSVSRDISSIRESEWRLQQAESLARIGHWQWDFAQERSQVSSSMCRIYGKPSSWEPTLSEVIAMVVEEDRDRVVAGFKEAIRNCKTDLEDICRVKTEKGVLHVHTRTHIDYTSDGKACRLVGTTQDISELKNYESRLLKVEFHDVLTGLPNRSLFSDRLEQALHEAMRHNTSLGLMVLGLDRFKEINDTHGHELGDRILYDAAQRLNTLVRNYDTVARVGGDEFAIILPGIREAGDLGGISRKILAELAHPFRFGQQEQFVSASIGIAVFPSDGSGADELLRCADSALRDAKEHGRGSFRYYSAALTAKSRERSTLEAALRRAVPEKQLELYYQPKIDLETGLLTGAEALLRWNHPKLGLTSPDKIIPVAENSGLITGIGAWVLTEACRTAERWNRQAGRALKIAINLSPLQFRDADLVALVCNALAATDCEPGWLEFEITESLLLGDNDGVRNTLLSFRKLGISIAIDDFGTGYSALGYLKRFPIDVLKIDRSFTSEVILDRDSAELVKVIISMAHTLRLKVVAEGIETDEQTNFLREQKCHLGQGYRFGKPMPVEAFEALPGFSRLTD